MCETGLWPPGQPYNSRPQQTSCIPFTRESFQKPSLSFPVSSPSIVTLVNLALTLFSNKITSAVIHTPAVPSRPFRACCPPHKPPPPALPPSCHAVKVPAAYHHEVRDHEFQLALTLSHTQLFTNHPGKKIPSRTCICDLCSTYLYYLFYHTIFIRGLLTVTLLTHHSLGYTHRQNGGSDFRSIPISLFHKGP